MTHFVEGVDQVPETLLDAISPFVPLPIRENIVIDGLFIDKSVLREFAGVVVD